jgi:hypothetical protein
MFVTRGKCYTSKLERSLAIRINGVTIDGVTIRLGYPKDVAYPQLIPMINISLSVFIQYRDSRKDPYQGSGGQ